MDIFRGKLLIMKILACLPYWGGDQKAVESIAGLMADLLEEPTELISLAFVQRFDAPPPSFAIQEKVRHKFEEVIVWKCDRKAVGFPAGCNEMAYGLLNWVPLQRHLYGKFKDIGGILIIEGDCVITRRTWATELMDLLGKMQNMNRMIAGTIIPKNEHAPEHVNAVALYDSNIATKLPNLRGGPQNVGWDAHQGPFMVPNCFPSPLFKLDYKRPTITEEELYANPDVLVYHGVKDASGVLAVRKKWGI